MANTFELILFNLVGYFASWPFPVLLLTYSLDHFYTKDIIMNYQRDCSDTKNS